MNYTFERRSRPGVTAQQLPLGAIAEIVARDGPPGGVFDVGTLVVAQRGNQIASLSGNTPWDYLACDREGLRFRPLEPGDTITIK